MFKKNGRPRYKSRPVPSPLKVSLDLLLYGERLGQLAQCFLMFLVIDICEIPGQL